MLIAFYHAVYDCLILIAPWLALVFYGSRVFPELEARTRWIVAALLAVPAANYLSTLSGRNLLGISEDSAIWQMLTATAGVCLLLALVVVALAAWKAPGQTAPGCRQAT
jgi:hypothetical protein